MELTQDAVMQLLDSVPPEDTVQALAQAALDNPEAMKLIKGHILNMTTAVAAMDIDATLGQFMIAAPILSMWLLQGTDNDETVQRYMQKLTTALTDDIIEANKVHDARARAH